MKRKRRHLVPGHPAMHSFTPAGTCNLFIAPTGIKVPPQASCAMIGIAVECRNSSVLAANSGWAGLETTQ